MYTLRELHEWKSYASSDGKKWVPAAPLDGPYIERIRDAWHVLMGKADAFTWPKIEKNED